MTYTIKQEDIENTTDVEVAFSTMRCLPKEADIPDEFYGPFKGYGAGNVYFRMADAMFCGSKRPEGEVTFNEGFKPTPKFMPFLTAHLRAFDPSHEHKMAGLAYMISKIVTIKESAHG